MTEIGNYHDNLAVLFEMREEIRQGHPKTAVAYLMTLERHVLTSADPKSQQLLPAIRSLKGEAVDALASSPTHPSLHGQRTHGGDRRGFRSIPAAVPPRRVREGGARRRLSRGRRRLVGDSRNRQRRRRASPAAELGAPDAALEPGPAPEEGVTIAKGDASR